MRNRTENRRTATRELPRDARAEEILEFVYNDEQEALCNEQAVLSHQSIMPAVQEFLREMSELDSQPAASCWH
jgi:hypothetical protein